MKKIPLKRIFAAAALVCCLTVTTAYADVTQEDIDNAKNQINNLKNQQKDAQDAVDDINGKKGELESDLNNLNGQMTNIVSSLVMVFSVFSQTFYIKIRRNTPPGVQNSDVNSDFNFTQAWQRAGFCA